jgi:hypothetical protein
MKNDREEELIFRGGEIADAIQRYQQKNGNALPPSLEVLVKGKFLRREYKDPMTKDGKWRFIRPGQPGQAVRGGGIPRAGFGTGRTTTTTTTTTRPSAFSQGSETFGGIQGVASRSDEESLRVFNGRRKYSEWLFLPGQPRVVGRQPLTPLVPGGAPGSGGVPGAGRSGPGQPQRGGQAPRR